MAVRGIAHSCGGNHIFQCSFSFHTATAMGVVSLRRYVERHSPTVLVDAALMRQREAALLSRRSAAAPTCDSTAVTAEASGVASVADLPDNVSQGFPALVDHLIFDMNAVAHLSYAHVASASSDGQVTATAWHRRVIDAMRKAIDIFRPGKTLAVFFDGPAPIAKLREQRQRRRRYGTAAGMQGASDAPPGPQSYRTLFSEAEVTSGSPAMAMLDDAVEDFLLNDGGGHHPPLGVGRGGRHPQHREPTEPLGHGSLNHRPPVLHMSGTRVPGEGEVKIAGWLHTLGLSCAAATGRPAYPPMGDTSRTQESGGGEDEPRLDAASDDTVVVLGLDSDLILTCAAATAFHNIFLVHPQTYMAVPIADLFLSWLRHSHGGGARLRSWQLASARIDFVYMMQLAGGDYFDGIEDEAIAVWNRYLTLRCTTRREDALLLVKGTSFPVAAAASRAVPAAATPPTPEVTIGGDDLANVPSGHASHVDPALGQAIVDDVAAHPTYRVNANFLREIAAPPTSKSMSRGGQGSSLKRAKQRFETERKDEGGGGERLLLNALWAATSFLNGHCPDYYYAADRGGPEPTVATFRAATQRQVARLSVPLGSREPLVPLKAYMTTLPTMTLLPASLRHFVNAMTAAQRRPSSHATSGRGGKAEGGNHPKGGNSTAAVVVGSYAVGGGATTTTFTVPAASPGAILSATALKLAELQSVPSVLKAVDEIVAAFETATGHEPTVAVSPTRGSGAAMPPRCVSGQWLPVERSLLVHAPAKTFCRRGEVDAPEVSTGPSSAPKRWHRRDVPHVGTANVEGGLDSGAAGTACRRSVPMAVVSLSGAMIILS